MSSRCSLAGSLPPSPPRKGGGGDGGGDGGDEPANDQLALDEHGERLRAEVIGAGHVAGQDVRV